MECPVIKKALEKINTTQSKKAAACDKIKQIIMARTKGLSTYYRTKDKLEDIKAVLRETYKDEVS